MRGLPSPLAKLNEWLCQLMEMSQDIPLSLKDFHFHPMERATRATMIVPAMMARVFLRLDPFCGDAQQEIWHLSVLSPGLRASSGGT